MVKHLKSAHPDCPLVLLLYVPEPANIHGTVPAGKIVEIEIRENEDTTWLERFVDTKGLLKCCNLCKLTRSSSGGVQMHVLASHFRYYPYQCSYCPKVALGVHKIKVHIEKEHQGKAYKVIRRGKLSYEHAQEHRHKDHEMIHMLDPLPEAEKDADVKEHYRSLTPPREMDVDPPVNENPPSKSPVAVKKKKTFLCKYCSMTSTTNAYNIQMHIFASHQKRKVATCNLCDFGCPMGGDEKMRRHFQSKHPGCEPRWENHAGDLQRIIAVEETEQGTVLAATDQHGEIVELDGDESTPSHSLKRKATSNESPSSKKVRTGQSPVRDLRQRNTTAQDSGQTATPGIDISKAAISKTCVDKVEERLASQRTLFGCSECYLLFDRKDKAVYHLQAKHDIKPYVCGICSNKYHFNAMAKQHMKTEHPDSSVPTLVQEDVISELRSRIITVMHHGLPNTLPVEGGGTLVVRTANVKSPVTTSPKVQCAKKSTSKPQQTQLAHEGDNQRFPHASMSCLKGNRQALYATDTSKYPNAKIHKWPPIAKEGNKWQCNYCTYKHDKRISVLTHVPRHTTWRPVSCKLCTFKSFHVDKCEAHIMSMHKDVSAASVSTFVQKHYAPSVYYLNKFTLDKMNLLQSETSPTKSKSPGKDPSEESSSGCLPAHEMKSIPELKVIKENPTIYQCNFCVFARSDHTKVSEHQLRHFTWSPFMCNYCSFSGQTKVQVQVHQKHSHSSKPQPPPKRIPRPKVYKLNEATCKKLQATASETEINQSFDEQGRTNTPPQKSTVSPKPGPKSKKVRADTVTEIPRPIVLHKKPNELYKCNYCTAKMHSFHSATRHQLRHFTWRPFKCPICSVSAKDKFTAKKHIQSVHGKALEPLSVPTPKEYHFRGNLPRAGRRPQVADIESETEQKHDSAKAQTQTGRGRKPVRALAQVKSETEMEDQDETATKSQKHERTVAQVPDPIKINDKPAEYKCNYCDLSRSMQSAVKLHQRSHFTWRPFACTQCSFQCFKQNSMEEHHAAEHQNKPPKPRTIPEPEIFYLNKKTCAALGIDDATKRVGKTSSYPIEGDEDPNFGIKMIPPPKKLKNGSYACHFCPNNSTTGTNGYMTSHQLFHFTHRSWSCNICKMTCLFRSKIVRHMEQRHPDDPKSFTHHATPPMFYFTFAAREMLGARIAEFVDRSVQVIKCYRCSETFDQDAKLYGHLALEHPECVQFQCLYCRCVLFTKGDFDEHHVELHAESLPDYDIQPVPDVDKGGQVCQICQKIIPNSFPMNTHMADQHKEEVDVKCSHCKGVFSDTSQLRAHHAENHQRKPVKYQVTVKAGHSKKVAPPQQGSTCPICQEKVKNEWSLDLHLVKEHPEHVQFLCNHCGRLLNGNKAMEEHFKQQHPNKKVDYSVVRNIKKDVSPEVSETSKVDGMCSECSSLRGKPLRIHIMDAHVQYRPYMCCHCPFTAASVRSVKDHHLANHSSETLQVKQRKLKRKEAKVDELLLALKAQLKSSPSKSSSSTSSPAVKRAATVTESSEGSPSKRTRLGVEVHILHSPKTKMFQCKLCKMTAPTQRQVYKHIYYKHKQELEKNYQ